MVFIVDTQVSNSKWINLFLKFHLFHLNFLKKFSVFQIAASKLSIKVNWIKWCHRAGRSTTSHSNSFQKLPKVLKFAQKNSSVTKWSLKSSFLFFCRLRLLNNLKTNKLKRIKLKRRRLTCFDNSNFFPSFWFFATQKLEIAGQNSVAYFSRDVLLGLIKFLRILIQKLDFVIKKVLTAFLEKFLPIWEFGWRFFHWPDSIVSLEKVIIFFDAYQLGLQIFL